MVSEADHFFYMGNGVAHTIPSAIVERFIPEPPSTIGSEKVVTCPLGLQDEDVTDEQVSLAATLMSLPVLRLDFLLLKSQC
jgi:hypothetical protein